MPEVPPEQPRSYGKYFVEPIMFLVSFASILADFPLQDLFIRKVCLENADIPEDWCGSLPEHPEAENLAQPRAAVLLMAKTLIETLLPALAAFWFGPWSDRTRKRMPLIIMPLTGYTFLYAFLAILSSIPTLPAEYLLFASVPLGLSGGLVSVFTAVTCIITDQTEGDGRLRTLRLGLLQAAFVIGLLPSSVSASYILRLVGYPGVFLVSGIATFLALLIAVFVGKDSSAAIAVGESVDFFLSSGFTACVGCIVDTCFAEVPLSVFRSKTVVNNAASARSETERQEEIHHRNLFDVGAVKEIFQTTFKNRPNGYRICVILSIASLVTSTLAFEGEANLTFMYTRGKFGWTVKEYTIYMAISVSIVIVGTVFGVVVLSHKLKIPDAPLLASIYLMKVASLFVKCYASQPWMMYCSSAVGALAGATSPLSRSIISKSVPPEDIGKVFSMTGSLESLTPLASSPLYTLLFNRTLDFFSGAIYLLSAAIFFFDFIFNSLVGLTQLKYARRDPELLQNEDE